MTKFRIRKIRAFTVNDTAFMPFRKSCVNAKKNMSKEVERFMKRYSRRT